MGGFYRREASVRKTRLALSRWFLETDAAGADVQDPGSGARGPEYHDAVATSTEQSVLLLALFLSACRRDVPTVDTASRAAIASRPYELHSPPRHDPKAPLLVFMHGFGGGHEELARRFAITSLADEHGFFVALPDGTPDPEGRRFWNASDACCNLHKLPVDDVAYLDAILDDATRRAPVDPARIYIAGYSNGGFMAHRYACDRPERVAAIASFAGDPWNDASLCKPRVPVSVLQVHGDKDEVVAYAGSPGGRAAPGSLPLGAMPAAKEGIAMWSRNDGCAAPHVVDDDREEVLSYEGCAQGSQVELVTIHGGTHNLDRDRIDMERVWAFLASHTRR
jgi:polyhydroxybutyrate depolymerase